MSREHVQKHPKDLVLTSEGDMIYVTCAEMLGLIPTPVSTSWAVNRAIFKLIKPSEWETIHFIWNIDTELDTLATLHEIHANHQQTTDSNSNSDSDSDSNSNSDSDSDSDSSVN